MAEEPDGGRPARTEARSADRPRTWLRWATDELRLADVPSPAADAEALLAHAAGVAPGELRRLMALDAELPAGTRAAYAELVERRRSRAPLQHITGATAFRYLDLRVEPGVFVPRPETEVVAQVAVDEAARRAVEGAQPLVVDLCCGAGGIALAVDTEVPASRVVAVDLAPEAVALTRHNQGVSGAHAVRIEQGDVRDPGLLSDLAGAVDVVVSNPPYIPPDAEPAEPEVRDHEPDLALYGGGADGLDIPRAVVRAAARLLRDGGLFVMEHAEVQADAVRALVEASGAFDDVATFDDLTRRPRGVRARRR